jgi:hypothetical protein
MRMSIDKQPATKEPQMAKKMSPTALSPDEIELLFESIALDHLFIETLQTRHRDSLDFHDVSVWGVKSALQAAFDAGLRAAGGAPKQPVHRSRKSNRAISANGSAAALQA